MFLERVCLYTATISAFSAASFEILSFSFLSLSSLSFSAFSAATCILAVFDSSAWARGQAWGLYGFTMAFRETGDPAYLQRARKAADFILGNPHLPEDLVPYWDHDAPGLPDAPRDASAAAITCSALYELGALLGADGVSYLDAADRLLMSLSGPDYRASAGENGGFILKHCVGNWPEHSEIDVPLSYADYYFLEANLRRLRLGQQAFAVGSGSLF